MNSKTNNFDLYSTFTYDDAKKYFESTSLDCKSDNNCPERSSCIGNKCIISFYCKKDDKSTCSLYTNFCNGKSCYKSDNGCNNNTDCLSGQCNNNTCNNYYYEGHYHLPKFSFDEYSINHFTYENAKNYYKKLNITCSSDDNCPSHTYCFDEEYPYEHKPFHCHNDEDCSSYCISHFYCKKDQSDCSFIQDEENKIRFSSKISIQNNLFGLENKDKCFFDKECIVGHCGCGSLNLFGSASCHEPSDSDSACAIPFVLFGGPVLLIEGTLIFLICINLFERYKMKRKGLIKEKTKSIKYTIIAGSIIGILIIAFFIYNYIYSYLSEQPL